MITKVTIGFALIILSSIFLSNVTFTDGSDKSDMSVQFGIKPNHSSTIMQFGSLNAVGATLENGGFRFAYAQEIRHDNNDLPYVSEYENSTLNKTDYIPDGMVILANSIPTDLKLIPAGGQDNSLSIEKINRYNTSVYNMKGTTGYNTVGFFTKNLGYKGEYVSLMIGNVTKSRDAQISFSFDIKGKNGNYTLVFVHGPLRIHGWDGNKYYEKINSYSSRLINLKDPNRLPGDSYSSLENIWIRAQPELSTSMEFRIDLSKTTENVPLQLPPENSYVVAGYFKIINPISRDSKYVFHNLEFVRLVNE